MGGSCVSGQAWFRQVKSKTAAEPHSRVVKTFELTDWNAGEGAKACPKSVPSFGRRVQFRVKSRPDHGKITTI